MKLLIVDDHPMIRKGLASILSLETNVEEIKEADSVKEAVKYIIQYQPDLAMIDLKLGKEDGLEIIQKIKEQGFSTKFIILTSSMKKEDFIRAQQLNVDGYVLKEAFVEDIVYAFHLVARGKKFFHPEILGYKRQAEEHSELEQLTQREKDVLKELGKGLNNVEIAERLFISEHTVKKHVSNIFVKLGLTHRTQAALMARDSINL